MMLNNKETDRKKICTIQSQVTSTLRKPLKKSYQFLTYARAYLRKGRYAPDFLGQSFALQLQFTIDIFLRTAVLRKLFDIRFSYKHCNFPRVCLLVEMVSKTVTRSIICACMKIIQTLIYLEFIPDILQIAVVIRRVIFLLFQLCFQAFVRQSSSMANRWFSCNLGRHK